MTASQVVAGVAVLVAACGIALMIAAAAGWQPRARMQRAPTPAWSWTTLRLPVAAGVGVVAWALTGWPALGLAAGIATIGLPTMVRAGTSAQDQIDRVEAVEEWTRRLADVLAIGVGLEQAIQTAARTAPPPVAAEVATLSARLAARTPTETALRRFADDLDDPTADLVVASLILASRRRGPGVAAALTAIADSVGEEVAARRRIEADRAKPRTTARAVTIITLVIIAAGLLNRSYTGPYGTFLGQLVLSATLGFFGAALWWMHSMTRSTRPARILAAQESDA